MILTTEPPRDKTNKITVRPEKTDQPEYTPSLIRVFAQWVAKDPSFLHADSEASDQAGWTPGLIWVSADMLNRDLVGFVRRRLTSVHKLKTGKVTFFMFSAIKWHGTTNKPPHDKTTKCHVRPAKNQVRVFAVRMKKAWVLIYPLST